MNKHHSNLLIALVALTLCDAPVLAAPVRARSKSPQPRQQAQTVKSKAATQPRQKPWTAEERAQKEEDVADIICDILKNAWGEVDRGEIKDLVAYQNNARLGQMWALDPRARLQVPTGYARDDRQYVNDVNKQISGGFAQGNRLFQLSQPVKGKKGPILTPYQKVEEMMDYCTRYSTMYNIHREKFDTRMQKAIQGVRNPNQRAELMDEWNNVKENINSEDRYDEGVSYARSPRYMAVPVDVSRVAEEQDVLSFAEAKAAPGPKYAAEQRTKEKKEKVKRELNDASRDIFSSLNKWAHAPTWTQREYDQFVQKSDKAVKNAKAWISQWDELGADDYFLDSEKTRFEELIDEINERKRKGPENDEFEREWDRKRNKTHSRSKQSNHYSADSGQDKNQSSSDFNASSKPRFAIKQDFDFKDTTLDMAFDALGLSESATRDDVSKQYKKLSLQHHPDRPGGNKEKFQKIHVAYQRLDEHFKNR